MGYAKVNGLKLYFEESGTGEETLFFSHSFMWRTSLYERQIEHFQNAYRCIAYDHRGHGLSEVTKDGYDYETFSDDTVALIEELDCGPCHFVGTSLGGIVGLRLGIQRPELLKSLILLGADADAVPAAELRQYVFLGFVIRLVGIRPLLSIIMSSMFGSTFRTDPAQAANLDKAKEYMLMNSRQGISRSIKGVFSRRSIFDEIKDIQVPALILDGEEDEVVPGKAERIHSQIEDSTLVKIPKAGHSLSFENPEAVNEAMDEFLGLRNKDNRTRREHSPTQAH